MKFIKYFFQFLLIIYFFLIFKILGIQLASKLGEILGKLLGPLFRKKNICKKNIQIAFGNLDYDKEKDILSGMWSNIGRTLAEYVYLKNFRIKKNSNHIKINGYEYLDEIKKSNKPVIFYSGHFANFELMAMEIDRSGVKCAAIYRPLNNIFLNPIMEYLRIKYICPIQIPKGNKGTREVVKRIKDGYSIAVMVDQRVSEGPRVDFFKKPAHTTTIPAQLAIKYDCRLVPISIKRENGTNFEMTVGKPYFINKALSYEENLKDITLNINKHIEQMIINNPKQWIWSHNRWK